VKRPAAHPTGDAGSIVLGWLTRLVLVLSLVGLVGFDAISIVVAKYTAADRATTAARAAAEACRSSKGDVQKAYDAAYAVALEYDDVVDTTGFSCAATGAVALTYRHQAATLLVEKIGPIQHWTDQSATGEAAPAR
jgi:hypothetical protein